MKIKFNGCDVFQRLSTDKEKKAIREIIEVLKNNNLSIAETRIVFQETLESLLKLPL